MEAPADFLQLRWRDKGLPVRRREDARLRRPLRDRLAGTRLHASLRYAHFRFFLTQTDADGETGRGADLR
jgi:hypothetical protein